MYYYYGTTEGMYGPVEKSKIRKSSTLTNALRGSYAMLRYQRWSNCYIVPNNRYTYRNAIAVIDVDGYGSSERIIAIKDNKTYLLKSDGTLGKKIKG